MDAKYSLILNGKTVIEVIYGTEYACEAWARLEELARFLNVPAFLTDIGSDPHKVVAEYRPEGEGYDEPDDIDDDEGFDPYEGCYTWDC